MQPSDKKAEQLRESIKQVIRHFRCMDLEVASQPHGELSIPEVHVIEFLGDRSARMMKELAEHLVVPANTLSTIVSKLEGRKLVRRRHDEGDRRIVMVELTDTGKAAYEAILEMRLNACRGMLTPLNEDEQDIFLVLMRKIGWGLDPSTT